ncbi:MAG: SprT family zinc-dependent metalloprotease [Thermoanaerobaculia bacterium]|nr:SprT family zinc-dependent metalloprotease [Thermoanaerobaculia bacterium]
MQLELFRGSSTPPGAAASRDEPLRRLWASRAGRWSLTWGVPDLRGILELQLSRRMRSSLGFYLPESKVIRISDVLLEAPPHVLEEIVCHEAAHAAVELLHGRGVRPHGAEWKSLMRRAGYEPRVRLPGEVLGAAPQRAARRRWVWEHRCPECRASRVAGRPVRRWRCAACRSRGRSGRLEITRRPRQ